MSYDQTREAEQLRYLDVAIAEFILRYQSNPATEGRRTAILLPGGMGCTLLRARTPYDDSAGLGQTFQYDTLWLDAFTFLGNALNIAMQKQPDGSFRDLDNRIVIANGSVDFLDCTPYDGFTAWCELHGIDWFIYGWDWRRRVEEVGDFFVIRFLPRLQAALLDAGLPDPLANFTVLGHSFGGMVVNLVNRRVDAVLDGMRQAITVGAPFYGYGGQIHRWFEGDSMFNDLGKLAVIRVIASLPGVYTLGFLDAETFATYGTALKGDTAYPLSGYPSMDATAPTTEADPFNPPTTGPERRYPTDIGFDMNELAHAHAVYNETVQPMPAGLEGRFFCVRGVRPVADTAGAITWGEITTVFNPNTFGSPITDGPDVPGDDTQPAWTARLVTQTAEQIVTVQADLHHMFMLDQPEVLAAIGGIMALTGPLILVAEDRRRAFLRRPDAASPERAFEVIRGLQALRTADRPDVDRPTVEAYLEQFSLGTLRAVARRVIQDVLKRPNLAQRQPSQSDEPSRKPDETR